MSHPSVEPLDLTVLLLGGTEQVEPFIEALEAAGLDVESARAGNTRDSVTIIAPDLVLALGDAVEDGGRQIRAQIHTVHGELPIFVICSRPKAMLADLWKYESVGVLEPSLEPNTVAERLVAVMQALEQGEVPSVRAGLARVNNRSRAGGAPRASRSAKKPRTQAKHEATRQDFPAVRPAPVPSGRPRREPTRQGLPAVTATVPIAGGQDDAVAPRRSRAPTRRGLAAVQSPPGAGSATKPAEPSAAEPRPAQRRGSVKKTLVGVPAASLLGNDELDRVLARLDGPAEPKPVPAMAPEEPSGEKPYWKVPSVMPGAIDETPAEHAGATAPEVTAAERRPATATPAEPKPVEATPAEVTPAEPEPPEHTLPEPPVRVSPRPVAASWSPRERDGRHITPAPMSIQAVLAAREPIGSHRRFPTPSPAGSPAEPMAAPTPDAMLEDGTPTEQAVPESGPSLGAGSPTQEEAGAFGPSSEPGAPAWFDELEPSGAYVAPQPPSPAPAAPRAHGGMLLTKVEFTPATMEDVDEEAVTAILPEDMEFGSEAPASVPPPPAALVAFNAQVEDQLRAEHQRASLPAGAEGVPGSAADGGAAADTTLQPNEVPAGVRRSFAAGWFGRRDAAVEGVPTGAMSPSARAKLRWGALGAGVLLPLALILLSMPSAPGGGSAKALAAVEIQGSLLSVAEPEIVAAEPAPAVVEREAVEPEPELVQPEEAEPAEAEPVEPETEPLAQEAPAATEPEGEAAAEAVEEAEVEPEPVVRQTPQARRRALRARVRSAARMVTSGHKLRRKGRLARAEEAYHEALGRLPGYPRAMAGLVQVHLKRRDGSKALEWASKLTRRKPRSAQNQLLLGDAYALAGDRGAARQAWRKASMYGSKIARKRLRGGQAKASRSSGARAKASRSPGARAKTSRSPGARAKASRSSGASGGAFTPSGP